MSNNRLHSRLRIVWAIARKDLVEALHNKSAIGIFASVLFVVLLYRFLPTLTATVDSPTLVIYDAGDAAITTMLENSTTFDVRTGYHSEGAMEARLAHEDTPALGLSIPANFDAQLDAGAPPKLVGHVLHWVSADDARELQQLAEGEIAGLLGISVPVQMAEERVYPRPDSGGLSVSLGMSTVYITVMMGMLLPPHLMLEEKKDRTLDALLVSPATAGDVVVGKALACILYTVAGCAVAFGANSAVMVHWGLAAAGSLAGALFGIALGLLLGSLLESRQQLMLWGNIIVLPLMLSMIVYLIEELVPAGVQAVVGWLPVSLMFRVIRTSFAGRIAPSDWAPQLLALTLYALALLGAVVWAVRRTDRS
jgi:ABC-2 type transport system permease protein